MLICRLGAAAELDRTAALNALRKREREHAVWGTRDGDGGVADDDPIQVRTQALAATAEDVVSAAAAAAAAAARPARTSPPPSPHLSRMCHACVTHLYAVGVGRRGAGWQRGNAG
jgi:hypothetical protein